MAHMRELHVWQDKTGRVKRVEFHDGPQRMEVHTTRLVRTDDVDAPPVVEATLIAKPIYHYDEPSDAEPS
jgi:hypothetical protein